MKISLFYEFPLPRPWAEEFDAWVRPEAMTRPTLEG